MSFRAMIAASAGHFPSTATLRGRDAVATVGVSRTQRLVPVLPRVALDRAAAPLGRAGSRCAIDERTLANRVVEAHEPIHQLQPLSSKACSCGPCADGARCLTGIPRHTDRLARRCGGRSAGLRGTPCGRVGRCGLDREADDRVEGRTFVVDLFRSTKWPPSGARDRRRPPSDPPT